MQLWLSFQKVHYTYDDDRRRFQALEFDVNRLYSHYQNYKGWEGEEAVAETKTEYGDNK